MARMKLGWLSMCWSVQVILDRFALELRTNWCVRRPTLYARIQPSRCKARSSNKPLRAIEPVGEVLITRARPISVVGAVVEALLLG